MGRRNKAAVDSQDAEAHGLGAVVSAENMREAAGAGERAVGKAGNGAVTAGRSLLRIVAAVHGGTKGAVMRLEGLAVNTEGVLVGAGMAAFGKGRFAMGTEGAVAGHGDTIQRYGRSMPGLEAAVIGQMSPVGEPDPVPEHQMAL